MENSNHVGKKIKVYFRNSPLTCEGIISKWENNTAVLTALDSNDVLYLSNIKEDVMMIRFFLDRDESTLEKHPPIREPELPEVKSIPQAQGNNQHVDKHGLRLKKLAQLRKIQQKEVKQNIASRVRSHVPTDISRVVYEQPNFTK